MHTLRGPTLQGLILSCRNFTRWFVRYLSPKSCAEFSWFFVYQVLLVILLRRTIFWNLKITENNLFKKISAHGFEDHIRTNKLEEFFSKKLFFKDLELFCDYKTTGLGLIFFHKKNNFVVFFKCDYLILIQY